MAPGSSQCVEIHILKGPEVANTLYDQAKPLNHLRGANSTDRRVPPVVWRFVSSISSGLIARCDAFSGG